MIKKTLAAVLACSMAAVVPVAHADDHRHDHRGGGHWDHRDHRPDWHGGPPHRGPVVIHRGPVVVHDRPVIIHDRPVVVHRDWARGQRFDYRPGGYYVVNDWHSRRLYAPPSGYQWVQSGSQFLLVAIASGLIANIILSSR